MRPVNSVELTIENLAVLFMVPPQRQKAPFGEEPGHSGSSERTQRQPPPLRVLISRTPNRPNAPYWNWPSIGDNSCTFSI